MSLLEQRNQLIKDKMREHIEQHEKFVLEGEMDSGNMMGNDKMFRSSQIIAKRCKNCKHFDPNGSLCRKDQVFCQVNPGRDYCNQGFCISIDAYNRAREILERFIEETEV